MMESVGTALRATARVARTRRRGGDAVRFLVRATLAVALQATSSPYVRTYGGKPPPYSRVLQAVPPRSFVGLRERLWGRPLRSG